MSTIPLDDLPAAAMSIVVSPLLREGRHPPARTRSSAGCPPDSPASRARRDRPPVTGERSRHDCHNLRADTLALVCGSVALRMIPCLPSKGVEEENVQERIQRYGGYLAAMVLPNIGAILAWGLITALFIDTGWLPNKQLSALVGPMITYMIPLLIAYTGGKLVYGHRGGVVGVVATMGIIIGSTVPMFLGAMIVGPIGGCLIKKFDERLRGAHPERLRDARQQLLGRDPRGDPRDHRRGLHRPDPRRGSRTASATSSARSSAPACCRSPTSRSRSARSSS